MQRALAGGRRFSWQPDVVSNWRPTVNARPLTYFPCRCRTPKYDGPRLSSGILAVLRPTHERAYVQEFTLGSSMRNRGRCSARGKILARPCGLLEDLEARRMLAVFSPATGEALRSAIATADSNGDAVNTINLSAGAFQLTNEAAGALLIQNQNAQLVPNKTLDIIGAGPASTTVEPSTSLGTPWNDRVLTVVGSEGAGVTVLIENVTISGGSIKAASANTQLPAEGGGLLVDGGQVTLSNAVVSGNQVVGAQGINGGPAAHAASGASGQNGGVAQGGGVYLQAGTLDLTNGASITHNNAIGGAGGNGGAGGATNAGGFDGARANILGGSGVDGGPPAKQPGNGGVGGDGGDASGGGLYVAAGSVTITGSTLDQNSATGGIGGNGGSGAAYTGFGGDHGAGKGGWGGNARPGAGGHTGIAGSPGQPGNSGGPAQNGGAGGDGGDGGAVGSGGGGGNGGNGIGGGALHRNGRSDRSNHVISC